MATDYLITVAAFCFAARVLLPEQNDNQLSSRSAALPDDVLIAASIACCRRLLEWE